LVLANNLFVFAVPAFAETAAEIDKEVEFSFSAPPTPLSIGYNRVKKIEPL
jgi:hypothetical protein